MLQYVTGDHPDSDNLHGSSDKDRHLQSIHKATKQNQLSLNSYVFLHVYGRHAEMAHAVNMLYWLSIFTKLVRSEMCDLQVCFWLRVSAFYTVLLSLLVVV